MELIKQNFSIKDLENLSGIKAHTIRIWEKRYNILNPDRTSTNIRTYDSSNLQKILNVAFLNEHGYKISRISKLSDEEIAKMVRSISASTSKENRAQNSFKLSMMNFDEELFNNTYETLQKDKSFRQIFHQVFLPLLEQIGMLWQTDTIKPIHEHYIVDLIKQKLYFNLAEIKKEVKPTSDKLYVLFLPENEIHDIGIIYLYYELLYHGNQAIYLGPSLPLTDLGYLLERHDNLSFVSYFTTAPGDVEDFINQFNEEVCEKKTYELLLFGHKIREIQHKELPAFVKTHTNLNQFIDNL
ncbi:MULTISPECIES: MerR family transcriptional regulator [Salegentibacter]|uniref:B12 binding domain-containing protein n=1 Tax=Salegentibacter agarivorans TaxID=345907 RepID=A0A1I2PDW7_9FLAO|nr:MULTISPECIES: MerR family transcriptional regulator [Salegentibacter]APS40421.1 MerR family transcriptional regulator [Salegentibacter sp. T436]SFG11856.1 B12 binding domain-containing protein [Salegentibacter agarivorans]